MPYTTLAQSAVDWALSKVGCAYSQAKRTQEDIFGYCQELCAKTTASLMKLVRRKPDRPKACSA